MRKGSWPEEGRGGQRNLRFQDSALDAAVNHSPSETPRLLHVDVWLSVSVWLREEPDEPPPHTHTPTHPSDTLAHTDTHSSIPVSHLSPSPQQTAAKGRPLIAAVRWDGPRGVEFQMTEPPCWYGHSGSCWGTLLPLLWPGANGPAPPEEYPLQEDAPPLVMAERHTSVTIILYFQSAGYKSLMCTLCITDSSVWNVLLEHWLIKCLLFNATVKIHEPDGPKVEDLPAEYPGTFQIQAQILCGIFTPAAISF